VANEESEAFGLVYSVTLFAKTELSPVRPTSSRISDLMHFPPVDIEDAVPLAEGTEVFEGSSAAPSRSSVNALYTAQTQKWKWRRRSRVRLRCAVGF
jgi:hypothetical protein